MVTDQPRAVPATVETVAVRSENATQVGRLFGIPPKQGARLLYLYHLWMQGTFDPEPKKHIETPVGLLPLGWLLR